jgi:hypothetical protein
MVFMPGKKKPSKIIMNCSKECLTSLDNRMKRGGKPDFTVTRATLDSAWSSKKHGHFGFVVTWETKSAGFGELTICVDKKTGKLQYDSEAMTTRFCKEVLAKLLDSGTDLFEEANKRNARKK